MRLLLELVLGAGTGGTDLGSDRFLVPSGGSGELVHLWYGFGEELPVSSRTTVTPSSMALSARGWDKSSLGFVHKVLLASVCPKPPWVLALEGVAAAPALGGGENSSVGLLVVV